MAVILRVHSKNVDATREIENIKDCALRREIRPEEMICLGKVLLSEPFLEALDSYRSLCI